MFNLFIAYFFPYFLSVVSKNGFYKASYSKTHLGHAFLEKR